MPIQVNIPGNSMTILGPVLNSKQLTIKGYLIQEYMTLINILFLSISLKITYNKVIDVYLNNKNFDYGDLDGLNYSTWEDQNQTLAQALSTEKNVMFVILFLLLYFFLYNNFKSNFFIKESIKILFC